jgi:transcriptional regulator with XRE-family HTH domain
VPNSDATLGERVTEYRTRRAMSQKELAAEVNRSESWVSQVERGVLKVDRLPVLQTLADALGVAVRDLRPDATAEPAPTAAASDMDALRSVLTGHPVPDTLLAGAPADAVDVDELRARVDQAWELTHASAFTDLNALLVELLPDLERAWRASRRTRRTELGQLLARAYQAASAAFARLDEADASWVSADRSLSVAEQSGDPLSAVAGLFRMGHAFITVRRLDQAQDVCLNGLAALQPAYDEDSPAPEVISLYGALTLVSAVVHARAGRRADARAAIDAAREIGRRLGEDRNDYNTEFGPTNVELHAVAVAADLGDAGEAIEVANELDVTGLSPERQSRFYIDVARAYGQRRHVGEAVHALLEAERQAPEQVHSHALVRDLVRELVSITGRRAPEELTALARRCAALQ